MYCSRLCCQAGILASSQLPWAVVIAKGCHAEGLAAAREVLEVGDWKGQTCWG